MAIIGILAGIAIPAYVDHASRSQTTRIYSEVSMYRTAIEQLITNGQTDQLNTDARSAVQFVDSELSTVSFGNFADVASSTISATFDGEVSAAIAGTTLTLQRSASGAWTCTIVGDGGGWSDDFKPVNCL